MARSERTEERPPQLPEWSGLFGYDELLNQWRRLIMEQALPDTLLLIGRRGIGKRSLLAALTAMHFCQHKNACGHCPQCLRVISGQHPEVLWLEAESDASVLIQDVEKLQDHLSLSPGLGTSFRIVVLVDADRLAVAAANRLLKILEEPPAHARIFFSTSRPGALLPTVLSRLVKWHLPPPPVAQSLQWLEEQLSRHSGQLIARDVIEGGLQQAALAPGVALKELLERVGAESRSFSLLQPTATAAEIVVWAEAVTRRAGRAPPDLLDDWEIALNQHYRRLIHDNTPPGEGIVARTERRELLRRARYLARGARVPLNAQLLAEALAIVSRP